MTSTGDSEAFRLVDVGLNDALRRLDACHVELLSAPPGIPPVHLASYAARPRPVEVQVVFDTEAVATSSSSQVVMDRQLLDAWTYGPITPSLEGTQHRDRADAQEVDRRGLRRHVRVPGIRARHVHRRRAADRR